MPQQKIIKVGMPVLHAGQNFVLSNAKRFNVLACGRRFGKTTLGITLLIEPALLGYPVAYFAPTYKSLAEIWRETIKAVKPLIKYSNYQDKRIELKTGGIIDMWSAEVVDASRGRKYKRIIIDEAAMIADLEELWMAAIRPALSDLSGDGYFLSTPKGQNYFRLLFNKGQDPLDPEWKSFSLPTSANPYIKASEIEAARNDTPTRLFEQEYLAIFLEDAGGCFRGVGDAPKRPMLPGPLDRHMYYAGVDLALSVDYTVLVILQDPCNNPDCVECTFGQRRVVFMDRFNKCDWPLLRARLAHELSRWRIKKAVVDRTGLGIPVVAQLRDEMPGINIYGFDITSLTKGQIVQGLALSIEKKEIALLADLQMIGELQAYEAHPNANGRMTYGAPAGSHDDIVIALCLGLWGSEYGRVSYMPSLLHTPLSDAKPQKPWSMDTR